MTSIDELDFSKSYTYADYYSWRFEERLELIKGKIFRMSPAPTNDHQRINVNLVRLIGNFLVGKRCEVFCAPYDVRLVRDELSDKKVNTVVQPDVCVICDPDKLSDFRGCLGAPDLVVEILSPGNSKRQLKIKYDLYEEFGVKEYWIVYPNEQSILQYFLSEDGKFMVKRGPLISGEKITTSILPGFELAVDEVFSRLPSNP